MCYLLWFLQTMHNISEMYIDAFWFIKPKIHCVPEVDRHVQETLRMGKKRIRLSRKS